MDQRQTLGSVRQATWRNYVLPTRLFVGWVGDNAAPTTVAPQSVEQLRQNLCTIGSHVGQPQIGEYVISVHVVKPDDWRYVDEPMIAIIKQATQIDSDFFPDHKDVSQLLIIPTSDKPIIGADGSVRYRMVDNGTTVAPAANEPVTFTSEEIDELYSFCWTVAHSKIRDAFQAYINLNKRAADYVDDILSGFDDLELDAKDDTALITSLTVCAVEIAEIARLARNWPSAKELGLVLHEALVVKLLRAFATKLTCDIAKPKSSYDDTSLV